jgi:thioredoxin 2
MAVTSLDENTFAQAIRDADKPLLIDFWADWCAPCQQMLPIFEQAAEHLSEHALFASVNTQTAPAVGFHYAIRTIPTVILFWRGQEIGRRAGVQSVAQICAWINSLPDCA